MAQNIAELEQEIRIGLECALAEMPKSSDDIRQILARRRQEKLIGRYHELSMQERFFMEAVSQPIKWPQIQPHFKLVKDDREKAIWNYARNVVSSFPENSMQAARCDIIV